MTVLTLPERVLSALEHEPLRTDQVAHDIGVDPAQAGVVLRGLLAQGAVLRDESGIAAVWTAA